MKHIFTILFLLTLNFGFSQNISGIINNYAAATGIDVCENTITIDDATNFSINDTILIVQMKGADMNITNTASFGDLANLNNTGVFEYNSITAISGNTLTLLNTIQNSYSFSDFVQVVNVPHYAGNVTVTSTLTAMSWNGTKGGILAFFVDGDITLNASIDVSGKGFLGGQNTNVLDNCNLLTSDFTDYFTNNGTEHAAEKGEGIVAFQPMMGSGRGKQFNGGGGGNRIQAGGGGGSGYGLGGIGSENQDPNPVMCDGVYPGIAGDSLNRQERYIFSGAGGAGHGNDFSNKGGNAGGLIFIKANSIIPNGDSIIANGQDGLAIDRDGGGGGGAGGSIYLDIANSVNFFVEALGGRGATIDVLGNDDCQGPGGGGGGGVVYATPTLLYSSFVNGGTAGFITNSTSACNGTPGSAQNGQIGMSITKNSPFVTMASVFTIASTTITTAQICSGDSIFLQNAWQTTAGVYNDTVTVATCDSTYQTTLTVLPNSSGTLDSTICNGTSFVFNGTTYDATNLSGTETLSAANGCDSVVTVNVTITPNVVISSMVSSVTICEDSSVVLFITATGSNVSYQWQINQGLGFVDVPLATNDTLIISNVTTPFDFNGNEFRVVINSDCGITISSITTLNVDYNLAIIVDPVDGNICENLNHSFIVQTNGFETSIQWQVNTGSGFFNLVDNSNYNGTNTLALNIINTPLNFNGNIYRAILSDNCGLTDTTTVAAFTVNPLPSITTQPIDLIGCSGSDVQFSITSVSTISYQWQVNSGSGFSNIIGEINPTLDILSVSSVINGSTYQVISTNTCGSVTSDIVTLTVSDIGIIVSEPNDMIICPDEPGFNFDFTVEFENVHVFQWQINTGSGFVDVTSSIINMGGSKTNSLNITIPYDSLNGVSFRLIYTDDCGFTNITSTYSVFIREPNPVNRMDDIVMCQREIEIVEAAFDGSDFVWQTEPKIYGQYIEPEVTDDYIVTFIQNSSQCRVSDTINIEIKDCLTECVITAPTGFSPNSSDGVNDVFRVIYGCELQYYELLISNRWGEIVFKTNDVKEGWDGTFKGKEVLTNNFIWSIVYTKKGLNLSESINGNVTLVR